MPKVSKHELWGSLPSEYTSYDPEKKTLIDNIIVSALGHAPIRSTVIDTERSTRVSDLQLSPDSLKVDHRVLHTINIIEYTNNVKNIIEKAKSQLYDINIDDELDAISTSGLLMADKESKGDTKYMRFKECNSEFENGICKEEIPEISNESAYDLLQISVATLLAHVGFSEIDNVALGVLTDVIDQYMKKLCKLLCVNADNSIAIYKGHGFQDVVDRTCHELGLGSIKNICDFYEKRVIGYRREMLHDCLNALNKLQDLRVNIDEKKNKMATIRFSETSENNVNAEVPELHVPNDDTLLSDSFETGFQMLHKLETRKDLLP